MRTDYVAKNKRKNGAGRPRASKAARSGWRRPRLTIALTEQEADAIVQAAERQDMPPATWARERLLLAVSAVFEPLRLAALQVVRNCRENGGEIPADVLALESELLKLESR